ncbi:MAG: diguanylate cyclase [Acidimicrobiales bacterium]|jgi:diguanylate cyclase (GGDEF)-like protein
MAEVPQARSAHVPNSHAPRLGIRSSLLMMVLVPTLATAALAASAAVGKWVQRDQSVQTRSATLELDALMSARAAVTDEYVPAAAIIYAKGRGLTISELSKVLDIDFASDLTNSQRLVRQQTILQTSPKLTADYGALQALQAHINSETATYAQIQAVFGRLTSAIDDEWIARFNQLSTVTDRTGSTPGVVVDDVTALHLVFSAFTAGLKQSTFAEQILAGPTYSSSDVAGLIASNEQYSTATEGFPGLLGKRATAAWKTLGQDPLITSFNKAASLAERAGLANKPPPYLDSTVANAAVFKGEIRKVNDLTALVLAAAADLRTTASSQESAATGSFVLALILLGSLSALMIGAALALAASVSRPLARIARAARSVRKGDFDAPPLHPSGPTELVSAALAFNEMTSTLRAVEAHAVALSDRDLADPVLHTPLPGRTGRALQGALDRLQESVRQSEQQRAELHALAIRDSLTGLLNRGAALDAIGRDLARAAREGGTVALLFIDLDKLKSINDRFGHEGGDEALRIVADAITASTRRADIRARIGGDEFVVATLQPRSQAEVLAMAERLRQRITLAEPELHGQRIHLACSIGIADSLGTDDTADDLIRRADLALYQAKQKGRDRVVWFHPQASRTA